MSRVFSFWRRSVAASIYCLALLSIVSLAALAGASLYFAKTTEDAANRFYSDGFVGVLSATRLELLLEQHRRIVESMPAEVDKVRLEKNRDELNLINSKLASLIAELTAENADSAADDFEKEIAQSFQPLAKLADRVVFYALNIAQDKATEFTDQYAAAAEKMQHFIQAYRAHELKSARDSVSQLSSSAKSLTAWVLISTIAAFVMIGPIGLTITRRVLLRLGRVTDAMAKVAKHDTAVTVPSLHDNDEVGAMARAVEVFKENAIELIARKKEAEDAGRQLDIALNNMTHGLCMFDVEQRLIICNERFMRMYNLPPQLSQRGTSLHQIQGHRIGAGTYAITNPEQFAAEHTTTMDQEAAAFTHELMDGRVIAVSQQPMPSGGWVAVHEDVTERRRSEAKIAHLARHDALTNLPNRVLFRESLEQAISVLERGQSFAVICLDLDQFKEVNDTLGHPVGDELLKSVARRLRGCLRDTDIVARLGGDEFAVIQKTVQRPEDSNKLATKLVEVISEPYDLSGKHVVIGASIGIALAPGDGSDPDQLLKNADMALYLAKKEGRGTHRFFEPEMDARLQARRGMEIDLRAAIVNGQFRLLYQPIVQVETKQITSFEALIRWNHPQRGQISPGEFIPLAEETGLILQIGEWVLRTACSQAAKWPDSVNVAVNLSPTQFKSRMLVQTVINALAGAGLSPGRLELEITESALLQNDSGTLGTLHQLRGLGIRVSMDDFGTGYSSLSYLRSFPFDKIKIDGSFVRDMPQREDCKAIVRAVASLARSLNVPTVAEGVETQEQFDMARAEGCNECQGFLLGRPMPESEVEKLLLEQMRVHKAA
jgi:diguanylate cyclase (GGDEF)-like protein